jgi:dihydrofolate reductase
VTITIQEFHAATVKETPVSKVRVNAFSVSADGFGAGPDQGRDQPLGRGGEQLHQWFVPTRTFQREVQRRDGGTTGIDNDFAVRSFENLGAWIMGRNMFGPVRGPWPDYEWKGWWGANPPYHVPVFVLTHHPRPPLEMEGGTVFHFVTEGIEAALDEARAAARGKDVRIGGGAATIRQYLQAGLLDEIHLAISPILLGQGEPPARRHRPSRARLQREGARLHRGGDALSGGTLGLSRTKARLRLIPKCRTACAVASRLPSGARCDRSRHSEMHPSLFRSTHS